MTIGRNWHQLLKHPHQVHFYLFPKRTDPVTAQLVLKWCFGHSVFFFNRHPALAVIPVPWVSLQTSIFIIHTTTSPKILSTNVDELTNPHINLWEYFVDFCLKCSFCCHSMNIVQKYLLLTHRLTIQFV